MRDVLLQVRIQGPSMMYVVIIHMVNDKNINLFRDAKEEFVDFEF